MCHHAVSFSTYHRSLWYLPTHYRVLSLPKNHCTLSLRMWHHTPSPPQCLFWGQSGARLWLQATEHIPGIPEAVLGLLEYIWNQSKVQEAQAMTQEGNLPRGHISALSPAERPNRLTPNMRYSFQPCYAMPTTTFRDMGKWDSGLGGGWGLLSIGRAFSWAQMPWTGWWR